MADACQEMTKRMGASSLETLGRTNIAEVAQRAGAGAIVVGGFRKPERKFVSTPSSKILPAAGFWWRKRTGKEFFALVDQLAGRIRDGIGFRDATGIRKVSDISTASLEAFQLYSQATDAMPNTRMDDAQKLLERAVTIDPGFAEAYLQLAAAHGFRGLLGLQRSTAQGGGACRPARRTAAADFGRLFSWGRVVPQRQHGPSTN